jgi:hypothetical protein
LSSFYFASFTNQALSKLTIASSGDFPLALNW